MGKDDPSFAPSGQVRGPAIICIDDGPGRGLPSEAMVIQLAHQLGGQVKTEPIGGRLSAITVCLEPGAAARFHAALALSGATFLGPVATTAPRDFVIIIGRKM